MKKIHFYTLLFCIAITNYSCNLYNYNTDEFEERLVINAILYSDSLSMHLSKTTSATDEVIFKEEKLLINNAIVVFKDISIGKEYDLVSTGKGRYVIKEKFVAIPNHVYVIKVSVNGFPDTISEEVIMPQKPMISYKNVEKAKLLFQNDEQKAVTIDFTLLDEMNTKNHYNIRSSSVAIFEEYLPNIKLSEGCELLPSIGGTFSDKCFADDKLLIDCLVQYPKGNEYIEISFNGISQSLYKYYQNRDKAEGLEAAFVEPSINYSNIKNGYGVFVAINSKKLKIKI